MFADSGNDDGNFAGGVWSGNDAVQGGFDPFGQGVEVLWGAQGDDGEMANRWRGLDKGDQALAVRDGDQVDEDAVLFADRVADDLFDKRGGVRGVRHRARFEGGYDNVRQRGVAGYDVNHGCLYGKKSRNATGG